VSWEGQLGLTVPGRRIDGSEKHSRFPGHRVNFHAESVQTARWPSIQADSPSGKQPAVNTGIGRDNDRDSLSHLSVRDTFRNWAFNVCAVCAFLRRVSWSKAAGAERTVTKRAKSNRATRASIVIVAQRKCRPAAT